MKKRIFALLMAMVLVFGMNTTFLAADSASANNKQEVFAAPGNVKISEEGIITFDLVEGAAIYVIEVGCYSPINGDGGHDDFIVVIPEAGATQGTYNLVDWLKARGADGFACDYDVRICAVSSDPNEKIDPYEMDYSLFYGSEFSNIFKYRLSGEKAEEALNEALKSETPRDVVNAVSVFSATDLQDVLRGNAGMLAKIAASEKEYFEEVGYNVAVTPAVSVDGVDASKITVYGALLSAYSQGVDKVELKVAASTEEVSVPETYANAVKLDIELLFDGKVPENLAPVIITMPIPTGVSAENLVILHYHEEGKEPQVITPIVNADGTMTFVVDGFSTFVVANIEASGAGEAGKLSDSTGDTDPVGVLVAMMVISAGVAVVVLKKKNSHA